MLTTVEVLRLARALIADESKWIKGADALPSRNADPEEECLNPEDSAAVCWCAGGAICHVAVEYDVAEEVCKTLASHVGVQWVYEFNDAESTTHADVLAAFDKAIATEEAKA